MNKLVISLILSLASAPALARDGAYYHDPDDLTHRTSWMSSIKDETKITRISIPGTHDTASRHYGDITKNQTLTIRQQLDAGIRYFDIRLKSVFGSLHLYHGPMYLWQTFNEVMTTTRDFLNEHPSETVLMRIKKEQPDLTLGFNFEENINHHINLFSDTFWNTSSSSYIPSLSEVRGKVVILKDYSSSQVTGIRYSQFDIQDKFNMSNNWDLYDKWQSVKGHLQKANANQSDMGYINYLSASGSSYPYFVASGHVSNDTWASRLSTGLTTPGWENSYPDFPRTACFIGICTISFEGTNILTRDYLTRSDMVYAGIVAADFPGEDLIAKVIDLNQKPGIVKDDPFAIRNAKYQSCFDFRGGVSSNQFLSLNPNCHVTGSQVFKYELGSKQLRVNGTHYCLDVKDAQNKHRQPVIAYSCHSGKNQQWQLNSDRTISSLMSGTRRCLDVDQNRLDSYGNPTMTILEYSPGSPVQQFDKFF
ncbi:phosphatidylinositol-specific phospholipase C-like protein,putative carbohydrate-binding protein [Shewanella psychrophila]|uniref:1-phosphatidylinositol phosphodiesterase n=1 Tax=Shewanella psychrophila TaxID=225848 RepID=A0A1S6HN06_9GAMM|nr:phosphatidylinositol-specific phospholipase C domain-containing protein [Shewanella psychrophila]AQS36889.1 phosphatidylinositol-specific phospholipase C-like protein,putative carbohydrate-binding protein [Shewanella psychrophila]